MVAFSILTSKRNRRRVDPHPAAARPPSLKGRGILVARFFEIGVAIEGFFVELEEAAGFLVAEAVFADGALPTKVKQIIAVAVAHVTQCPYCIKGHTKAALRHGGLEQVELSVDGATLAISPITPSSGPVVLGQELRDLGAAVAVIVIRALGGSVAVDGGTLAVKLPE